MIFLKDKDGELIGLVKREMTNIIRYKDRVGQERVAFKSDPYELLDYDADEMFLIGWEVGDVPSASDLDQAVRDGARCFWYVNFGTDMYNLLAASDDEFDQLSQESRDLIGRSLFEHLTT
jgi:hypothetical protein